jgi:hypothetical protein
LQEPTNGAIADREIDIIAAMRKKIMIDDDYIVAWEKWPQMKSSGLD